MIATGVESVAQAPAAVPQGPPRTSEVAAPSLRSLAVRGSVWTVAGFGASQVLRLASSLILTRLLFPEAFGVMAVVGSIMFGVQMLSDLGVAPTIIFHPRGADPALLNTAFTLNAVRGAALWLIASALAWPAAVFFDEPRLASIVPVAALSALIGGFNSTNLWTAQRNLSLSRTTASELLSQLASLVVTLSLAWAYRSVWAIVAGGLAGALVLLALSHLLVPGIRNRFRWEPESARILLQFGRWVFISSALFFATVQSDRLMLGGFLDLAALGVYMIALNLSEPFVSLNERVWRQVMLPALSQVFRDRPERLTEVLYRGRRATGMVFSVGSGAMAMVGGSIVHLLYDDRYAAAGWMLQIFALRIFARSIAEPLEQCASAIREPRLVTMAHAARTTWVLVGIPVAWHLWGLVGLVGAAATADLPNIIVFWIALGRRRILRVAGELSPCLLGAAGVALGAAIAAILNLLPPHFRLR